MIGGSIYASTIKSGTGQQDTRFAFLGGGLLTALGGLGLGQFKLKERDKLLVKAVDKYNQNVEFTERISVDLFPAASGKGGEIKTQVPF